MTSKQILEASASSKLQQVRGQLAGDLYSRRRRRKSIDPLFHGEVGHCYGYSPHANTESSGCILTCSVREIGMSSIAAGACWLCFPTIIGLVFPNVVNTSSPFIEFYDSMTHKDSVAGKIERL